MKRLTRERHIDSNTMMRLVPSGGGVPIIYFKENTYSEVRKGDKLRLKYDLVLEHPQEWLPVRRRLWNWSSELIFQVGHELDVLHSSAEAVTCRSVIKYKKAVISTVFTFEPSEMDWSRVEVVKGEEDE